MPVRKGSSFNIAVPIEGAGDVLLFNTATGGLLRIDEDTYATVRSLFQEGTRGVPRDWAPPVPGDLDPDVADALEASGFLVAGELDEIATLRDGFERERDNPDLKFTIGLTMQCNFACPYCFEEHRNEHMTMAVADAVFGFIQQHMRDAHATSLFVNWFGGEPLLNLDVLCYLSERLRREAADSGAHYESMIITNGALLTREVAERLRAAGVEAAQVTLDGPAEVHNQRRPFKGGQASFDRILANLRDTFDVIRTTIRVNVDEGNHASQAELVRVLAAAGVLDGPHAARIYAGKVTRYTEQSEMLWAPLTQRAIASMGDPIASELGALGLPVLAKGSPLDWVGDKGGCSAMRKHSFVIGPSGQTFKCELGIHDDREALGMVGPIAPEPTRKPRRLPVVGQAFGTRAHNWSGHNPYDSAKCSSCQFVPVCKGGCPKRVMESETGFMQETCDYWDHNYKRLITDFAGIEAPAPS